MAWAQAAVGLMAWALTADLGAFETAVRAAKEAAAAAPHCSQPDDKLGWLLRHLGTVPPEAIAFLEARARKLWESELADGSL